MTLRTALLTTAAFCTLSANSFASLIYVGTIPATGQGHGAVYTSVTFQNTGTESGCVGANTGGTKAYGGGNVYLGSAECPTGFTGGDETKGNGPSGLYTASDLGIGAGQFGNLIVLFNGVQSQNSPSITLDNLALDLFSTSGTLLASYQLTPSERGMVFNAFPGTGNAGFGFQLDPTQAAQANSVLQMNPNLLIGSAATTNCANGGPETISFTKSTMTQTPEPASFALVGAGVAAVLVQRRRKSQAATK